MEKTREETVKDMLKKFTDDFSSVDVDFILDLDYPKTIEVQTVGKTEDETVIVSRTVENLSELNEVFKKIPVEETTVIKIPSVIGRMVLRSRSGC